MEDLDSYSQEALDLLKRLISTQSFSKEEDQTAELISDFFTQKGVKIKRVQNNIIAYPKDFNSNLPSIWLNSHHDTVKPNTGYTLDPFSPIEKDGKLYGLGSNDAGGCLVSLMATFLYFYEKEIPVNLILIASAEEEISGKNGISSIIEQLPACDVAIVGEPTLNMAAVSEKGLMVIDAITYGKSGHAARNEGVNAIYEALDDLETIRGFEFQKESPFLGKSKVTATVIQAGEQHNVVPNQCKFVLDVRLTDAYSLEDAFIELSSKLRSELTPRSMRLQPSFLPEDHLIQKVLDKLCIEKYGSPTLSDQALIPYPSVKIGPGDSARSHMADEFIYVEEISSGITNYVKILEMYFNLLKSKSHEALAKGQN